MTRKRSLVGAIALIALTAMVVTGAISASAGSSVKQESSANQLVGSWDVTVNRGPALPPLRSLQTYTRGRGVVEIANGGTALRGPSHGAWERVEGRLYASTIVFFRFDPQTGAYLGTQHVNSAMRLAQDGESFTAVALSELRDPDGNVVASGLRASVVGQRIDVERIPDQP